MRRLLTWAVVTLGIAAVARRLRRRRGPEEVATTPEDGDPADELRRKLAESRAEDEAEPAAPEPTVEERRANVHAEGRATVEQMREPDEG